MRNIAADVVVVATVGGFILTAVVGTAVEQLFWISWRDCSQRYWSGLDGFLG